MKTKLYFDYIFLLENTSFSFEQFKSLSWPQNIEYAQTNLPLLSDEGGGRIVFDLGGNKILKVARNNNGSFQGGINQNKKEIDVYHKFNSLDFFPVIFDFDHDNFSWIVYEKVKTFKENQNDALEPHTGLHDDELETLFGGRAKYTVEQSIHPERYPELEEEIEEALEFYPGWRGNSTLKKIFFLIDHGLHPQELIVRTHYGTTSDGKLVLVDFGH